MVKKILLILLLVLGATISGDFGTGNSAHWTFDAQDGADSTANNNDLTNNGSVTFTSTGCLTAYCSVFSGSNEYFSITDASQTGLDLTGDFSMSFWIDPVTDSTEYEGIFSKDTNGANNTRSYILYYDERSTDNFNLALFPTGYSYPGYWAGQYAYNLTEGSYTHVVITCDISGADNSKCYLYINGTGQGYFTKYDGTGATSIQDTATAVEMGWDSSGHVLDFNGKLDDFTVWKDRILDSTEVTTLFNAGTPLDYSGGAPATTYTTGISGIDFY